MSERMNKERAIEQIKKLIEFTKKAREVIGTPQKDIEIVIGENQFYLSDELLQALDIAIECVEEKIKREKNAHRGKHKAYWTYTGNGTDSGTGLEIQCSYCGKKYNIFNADETKPFSYEKYQECLDEHCMRECPNCKREMVGWRKYYHSYQKPTPIRYYERKE